MLIASGLRWKKKSKNKKTKNSGANLPAPVSTEAALCGSNGSAVYSLIQCVVPAVQHPPCMFTPPTSRLRTHQCGEQCALFTDCPAVCLSFHIAFLLH